MALPASDSFSQSTGGTQALTTYSANWAIVEGGFNVPSGANAAAGSALNYNTARWIADTFNAAQYSRAMITATLLADGTFGGVAVRCQAGAITLYHAHTDGTNVYVDKSVANVKSGLAGPIAQSFAAGDYIGIEVEDVGATVVLRLYRAAAATPTVFVQFGSDVVDSAADRITAAGSAGIFCYDFNNAGNCRITNWSGGNLTVSATPVEKDFAGSYGVNQSIEKQVFYWYTIDPVVGTGELFYVGDTTNNESLLGFDRYVGGYPASLTTAVTKDFSGAYGVFNAVTKDFAGAYSVVQAVEKDFAAAFSTFNAVQKDLAAAYDVVGTVAKDFTGAYSVIQAVQKDFSAAFSTFNAVQKDLSGAYTVSNAVQKDFDGSYALAGSVTKDFSGAYSVVNAITKDFSAAFSTFNAVQKDLAAAYGIFNAVTKDFSGAYEIPGAVTKDFSGAYGIASVVTKDFSGAYDILSATQVIKDFDGSYALAGSVTKDLSGTYTVVNAVQKDLSGAYGIFTAVQKDLSGAYSVVQAVQKDLSGAYGIGGAAVKDFNGSFSIEASVMKDFSGTYSVVNAVQKDLSGAYSLANAVQKDLAAVYSIGGVVIKDLSGAYSINTGGGGGNPTAEEIAEAVWTYVMSNGLQARENLVKAKDAAELGAALSA